MKTLSNLDAVYDGFINITVRHDLTSDSPLNSSGYAGLQETMGTVQIQHKFISVLHANSASLTNDRGSYLGFGVIIKSRPVLSLGYT